MGENRDNEKKPDPLFERGKSKGRTTYKLFASTIFCGICLIWIYRLTHVPKVGENGRWLWIGMFISELIFGLYWIVTQAVRWDVAYCYPFKNRLTERYEDKLPEVDVFVCTADPIMEPPTIVINTILSLMAFNYPSEKLNIYLSDDGGSEYTFYALLEASEFSKYWLPFCRKFNVEPRAPSKFFEKKIDYEHDESFGKEWASIKKQYDDMNRRIEIGIENNFIPKDIKESHQGFTEWNYKITKQDHQSIIKILNDKKNNIIVDTDGQQLPTLVYMSREKRPQKPHHYKAGAMNALIRVSSEISNAPIILNLDCDMYSNDPDAVREALCFFMDENEGHQVAFVQYPQRFGNITTNDLYANDLTVINSIELAGVGNYGAALYCGTGCFHRREGLSGEKYSKKWRDGWDGVKENNKSVQEMERASKMVANCSYEEGTQWGKEMGLVYGCPVEDVVTGLTIQSRGWKSVYYNPKKYAFVGIAPSTLDLALIQYTRWSSGMFQIFVSKYCPFIYGKGKIKLGAQMGYCVYLLWPALSFPTLCYVTIPSLSLLHYVAIFPKVPSLWFWSYSYVFCATYAYSLAEATSCGATIKGWWNSQRMNLIRRTSAYAIGGIETIMRQLGFSQSTFVLTAKVVDDDSVKRYEQEIMEFGSSSILFTIVATIAVFNLFVSIWTIMTIILGYEEALEVLKQFLPQVILNLLVVLISFPIYEAMFVRRDKGLFFMLPFSFSGVSDLPDVFFSSLALLKITVNPSAEAGSFTSHSPNFGNGRPFSCHHCMEKNMVINNINIPQCILRGSRLNGVGRGKHIYSR